MQQVYINTTNVKQSHWYFSTSVNLTFHFKTNKNVNNINFSFKNNVRPQKTQ